MVPSRYLRVLLIAVLLGAAQFSTAQETSVTVSFGRLNIHCQGVDGKPLDAGVRLFDESKNTRIASRSTGSNGVVGFNVVAGSYRVEVQKSNSIIKSKIRVQAEKETVQRIVFGKLAVFFNDDLKVRVYDQVTNQFVASGRTGGGGLASFYLRPGMYKIELKKVQKIFEKIEIKPGRLTEVGEEINHPPVIDRLTASPSLVRVRGKTHITVSAHDVDADPLSYDYSAKLGTVVGRGPTAAYIAPDQKGEYRIQVTVRDGKGGAATRTLFVSGGILSVYARGDKGCPLPAAVSVYDEKSTAQLASGHTGAVGVAHFFLRQGPVTVKLVPDRSRTAAVREGLMIQTDRETREVFAFGRMVVRVAGVDQAPLAAEVAIYDQFSGRTAATGNTGEDGIWEANLAAGTYKVAIRAANTIEKKQVDIKPLEAAQIRADFGQLAVHYNEDVKVYVYDQKTNKSVASRRTGSDGTVTFNLGPGIYKVRLAQPKKMFEAIRVRPGELTEVGEQINHPPIIDRVIASPALVRVREKTRIQVNAHDVDGDSLTYTYRPSVGTISGSGPAVDYLAPGEKGSYRIDVEVRDTRGGTASQALFVSGGILSVYAKGAKEAPVPASVQVHDPETGKQLASGHTGPVGVCHFFLRQGPVNLRIVPDRTRSQVLRAAVMVQTDKESIETFDFGRMSITATGVGDQPVDARVAITDQKNNRTIATGSTGENGWLFFDLPAGRYTATTQRSNKIEQRDIVVSAKEEIVAASRFGLLSVYYNEDISVGVYDQQTGRSVSAARIGADDVAEFYLRGGVYRVKLAQPKKSFENIQVVPGKQVQVGDRSNHPPIIDLVSASPALVRVGEKTQISVKAHDLDDDKLSYSYAVSAGTIVGTGKTATYHAPDDKGVYRIRVAVSDGQGATASKDLYVSGGILDVHALGAYNEPIPAAVRLFESGSGRQVASGSTGRVGAAHFFLPDGTYRLELQSHTSRSKMIKDPIEITTDKLTSATLYFGRLTVISRGVDGRPLDSNVMVYRQSDGRNIAAMTTGTDGVAVFDVQAGEYTAKVQETNAIARENLRVVSREEFLLNIMTPAASRNGGNNGPSINSVSLVPLGQGAEHEYKVHVLASDFDGDTLTYGYASDALELTGNANEVYFNAPIDAVSAKIEIQVMDPHGGKSEAIMNIVF